jgi:threonine/homoserine/homoserine lactone efflux protein
MAIHNFETFLLTGILLNITPGNDTIFILSKSIGQGRKAGVISALGIGTGCLVHTLFAAFGLSVVIAESLLLFNIIRYAGAVYLLYMGVQMVFGSQSITGMNVVSTSDSQYGKIFRDAIITNVLNPKVALFFIAFLPQFIDTTATQTAIPFILLGSTFVLTGTIWCLMLALFASALFSRLKENVKISLWLNRTCGLALIGLGIKVALSGRK